MEDPNTSSPASRATQADSGRPPTREPLAAGVPRLDPPRGAAKSMRDASKAHPSYVFLAVVSIVTLASDIGTKLWAEHRLETYPPFSPVWQNHLTFTLARNRGGAWGLLQGASENVRRPFFLLVSVAAITFIVTLYRRLQPRQRSLKWGLPLVLGGALGNVFDRIRYGSVIDFIDYKAEWVRKMNVVVSWLASEVSYWFAVVQSALRGAGHAGLERAPVSAYPTDHWPTFNVADVAICVGVALMAIDMFTARRGHRHPVTGRTVPPPAPPDRDLATASGGNAKV